MVETSPWIWQPILHTLVLPRRPKESAQKYAAIWTEAGSPLLVNTRLTAQALSEELKIRGRLVEVHWAMRYGNPGMAQALRDLRDRGFDKVLVVPMYPQYSATTSGTVFDVIAREFLTWRDIPSLRFVKSFHDDPGYIEAVADSIRSAGVRPTGAGPTGSSSASMVCHSPASTRGTPTRSSARRAAPSSPLPWGWRGTNGWSVTSRVLAGKSGFSPTPSPPWRNWRGRA